MPRSVRQTRAAATPERHILPVVVSILLPGLLACRRKSRLTQVELARRVGLRAETICGLEKQRQAAGVAAINVLAEVLRVHPEHLTSGVDPIKVAREARRARRERDERQCSDCGFVKPVCAFTPIKQTQTGSYGRCRVCRASGHASAITVTHQNAKRRRPASVGTVSSVRVQTLYRPHDTDTVLSPGDTRGATQPS